MRHVSMVTLVLMPRSVHEVYSLGVDGSRHYRIATDEPSTSTGITRVIGPRIIGPLHIIGYRNRYHIGPVITGIGYANRYHKGSRSPYTVGYQSHQAQHRKYSACTEHAPRVVLDTHRRIIQRHLSAF